jgi:S-adenosylmethionine/arginine decarboxylase-like enzyme
MSTAKEIRTMQHIGASAFIALEDSGIMLHTITNKKPKFACIDVFSCKKFDPKLVDEFLKKSFNTDNIIFKFIKRGEEYNK